jgi:FdhD protein
VETGFNVVTVDSGNLAPVPPPPITTSSCGLCGSTVLADLAARLALLPASPPVPLAVLAVVPDRVRGSQGGFESNGAAHAAAVDSSGEPLVVREDIASNNAVDKVVGRLLLDGGLPAAGLVLFVSGRATFEIVQKAWAAGFSTAIALSAPSALAVATAERRR